eukprot:SAG11_NODE_3590_length_2350_cov_7.443803_3_plen_331_part_01
MCVRACIAAAAAAAGLDLLHGAEAYAGGFPRHFGSAGPERVHPRRTFQTGDAPYCERDCAGGRLDDVVRYFFGVPSPIGCPSVSQLTVLPHGLCGADLSSLLDRPGVSHPVGHCGADLSSLFDRPRVSHPVGHCGDRGGLHACAGSRFSFSQFALWAQVRAPAVDAFSAPGDICFALWTASPPRWFSRPTYSARLLSRRYSDNEPDARGLSPRYRYGGQFAALSGVAVGRGHAGGALLKRKGFDDDTIMDRMRLRSKYIYRKHYKRDSRPVATLRHPVAVSASLAATYSGERSLVEGSTGVDPTANAVPISPTPSPVQPAASPSPALRRST